MPQAIPMIVGAAASAALPATLAATTLFAGITVGAAVSTGVSLVVGSAMARREQKKASAAAAANARAATLASLKDIQSTVSSATTPTQTLYGRVLVGGVIPFWFTNGDVGQFHHWAQVLAAHPVDGVDAWYINEELVTVDGSGWVTTPKFCRGGTTPLIRVRLYDGTQATLDGDILAASAGALASGDCARGKAWVAVRFEADYDVFGQIGAPSIRCVVRGKKLFDPRTGLTVFSDNAALAVRDYLLGQHGLRCTSAEVNDTDLIAAANVCAEAVALAGGGTQARYTVNGALSAASGLKDNLEALVDAMAGLAVWSQGQWRVWAGAYQAPVRTLTESDVQQVEDVVAYTPRRELFNTVTGTFVDPASLYAERQYPIVTNATYVAADSGQIIERQINQPLVNDATRAQRLAKIEIERARQAVTVSLLCKWTAYDLTPGDHVALSLARYGWAGKVFFVAGRTLSAEGIRYVLRETAAAVWAWNSGDATTVDAAPNTNLPNPYEVPNLTGLAAQSGTAALQVAGDGTVISRIRVSWAAVASQYVQAGGRIEIQYKPQAATDYTTARADGDATATHVGPVEDGLVYDLRARAVNALGQRGAWASITHTVVGKTEPPPDVTAFYISGDTLSWPPVAAADLAGYQVRLQYGNNPWWPSAAPLHEGFITESPWVMTNRPAGPVTLMIKAVDTSGNTSVTPAVIVTDLGDPLVANVLLQWPQAPTWPGSHNGTVLGGELVALESDAFYGPSLEPLYGPDGDVFYALTTYADLAYTFGATPTDAGLLTLAHTISAASYTIQYRRSDTGALYGSDTDPFYPPPDTDPFYGAPGEWATWPGSLSLTVPEQIDWRVSAAGGAQRATFNTLTAILDVPDITERLSDVPIASGGTRLGLGNSFRAITSVLLTLQADAGNARSATVVDKNAATGPLIQLRDAAGAATSGTVDAIVQGY